MNCAGLLGASAVIMCVQCLAQYPRSSPRDMSQRGEGQEIQKGIKGLREDGCLESYCRT